MGATKLRLLAIPCLLLLAACAHSERPAARGEPPGAAAPPQPAAAEPEAAADRRAGGETPTSPQAVDAALRRALADGWRRLRIFDECQTDAGPRTVEIFGNGVAIWDRGKQFELTRDEIRRGLEAFVAADFAQMKAEYGGRMPPDPGLWEGGARRGGARQGGALQPGARQPGGPGGSAAATRVICQVVLELDGTAKRVMQLDVGEQSAALRRLAESLFEISRGPARSGIGAEGLTAGLERVAVGELAAETVTVVAHRKPRDAEGWLLRIDGLRASTRRFVRGEGYGDPVSRDLDPGEIAELARLMADGALGELPINLYAEHYTDLNVEVLDHRKSIQARRFAGMTPTLHGERQDDFDRVVARLEQLHRRLSSRGQSNDR